jgi:hypothetical protein
LRFAKKAFGALAQAMRSLSQLPTIQGFSGERARAPMLLLRAPASIAQAEFERFTVAINELERFGG